MQPGLSYPEEQQLKPPLILKAPADLELTESEFRVTPEGALVMVPKTPKDRSRCANFVIVKDGVISVSLRGLTLIGSITVTITLVIMLIKACNAGQVECTWRYDSPMVSDVICLPMFDRIWCILTTFWALGVNQVNIRAFYKRLHGKVSRGRNNFIVWVGLVQSIAFPLIGYFDEHEYRILHIIISTTFFVSTIIYADALASELWKHRNEFPKADNRVIRFMWWEGKFLWLIGIMFGVSLFFTWYVPVWEWILALTFPNYYTFQTFINPFYDSVEPRPQIEEEEKKPAQAMA